jgi:hypothetical chaperone protein
MMIIPGMDFGTTNSGMAVYDGQTARVLPLDPSNPNPRVARTALYITTEQDIHIGREALDLYFEQNIGRPVKMQKVWVGEIEVIADLVYYITDVYTFADALSPGRLFLSIKTGLRDENYAGTVIGQQYYSLETLIALYLTVTKRRAERLLGHDLRDVVLGRPVRFAADAAHDRIAEARLLRAAFQAGYEGVYLQYEPVAAAYSYEASLAGPENVLVFDFGGGTLDITVMRLGGSERQVLATGGIPVAGDVFDQKLVRAKLPRHFGEGSFYGPRHKAMTTPQWIYDAFSDWQRILELQAPENRAILEEIRQTAQRRHQIDALISLVNSNYGLKMFDVVEEAKRALSEKRGVPIYLDGPGFSVREFATRTEFEALIRSEIQAIEAHLRETVAASGLAPGQIDSIIRTGGSAQIPVFYEMLGRLFGPEKVRTIDTFSSVTAGLGITGRRLSEGELELPRHTAHEFDFAAGATGGRLQVRPVNLELLQRRIALNEQAGAAAEDAAAPVLVVLGDAAQGTAEGAVADVAVLSEPPEGGPLPDGWTQPVRALLTAAPDDQLVFVTSRYRFLLATARQLADAQALNLRLGDLHRLATREVVCAVANWSALRDRERLLIATSTGFARAYPLDVLRGSIEGPAPYQFDSPLPGVPVALAGVDRDDAALLITESGRGARWPVAALPLIGLQAVNCVRGEGLDRVVAAVAGPGAMTVAVVLADGYGRRLVAETVPQPPKANTHGRSLVARSSQVAGLAVVAESARLLAATNRRLAAVAAGGAPIEDSTRTYPLVKLRGDETVAAVASAG